MWHGFLCFTAQMFSLYLWSWLCSGLINMTGEKNNCLIQFGLQRVESITDHSKNVIIQMFSIQCNETYSIYCPSQLLQIRNRRPVMNPSLAGNLPTAWSPNRLPADTGEGHTRVTLPVFRRHVAPSVVLRGRTKLVRGPTRDEITAHADVFVFVGGGDILPADRRLASRFKFVDK